MALKHKSHDVERVAVVQRTSKPAVRTENEYEQVSPPSSALGRIVTKTPAALRPADILTLQRTVGNREVQRMLSNQPHSLSNPPSTTSPAIQRKTEEEEEPLQGKFDTSRRSENRTGLPDKLKAGIENLSGLSLDDERETSSSDEELQRMSRQNGEDPVTAEPRVESAIQSARGSGHSLPADLTARMEQAFGADFSGVRIHTDADANRMNQSLQSRAFTTGRDLFFKRGEYNPGSHEGQKLIAHELTHVRQQQSGQNIRVMRNGDKDKKTKEVNWKDLTANEQDEIAIALKQYEKSLAATDPDKKLHPLQQNKINEAIAENVFKMIENKPLAITDDNCEKASKASGIVFPSINKPLTALAVTLDGEKFYDTATLAEHIVAKAGGGKNFLASTKQCITDIENGNVKQGPANNGFHISHGSPGKSRVDHAYAG